MANSLLWPFVLVVLFNVGEAWRADLPDNISRFGNVPLAEEVAKRAERLLGL